MNKKSWLTRLDEADQKDQARLDRKANSGVETIFQKNKSRVRKQTKQEKTLRLTLVVYGFFILEVCTLGGLLLGNSASQEYGSSLGHTILFILWSAVLSVASIAIGIVALKKRPRLFYMHIPFILNCLLFSLIFIIFAF